MLLSNISDIMSLKIKANNSNYKSLLETMNSLQAKEYEAEAVLRHIREELRLVEHRLEVLEISIITGL